MVLLLYELKPLYKEYCKGDIYEIKLASDMWYDNFLTETQGNRKKSIFCDMTMSIDFDKPGAGENTVDTISSKVSSSSSSDTSTDLKPHVILNKPSTPVPSIVKPYAQRSSALSTQKTNMSISPKRKRENSESESVSSIQVTNKKTAKPEVSTDSTSLEVILDPSKDYLNKEVPGTIGVIGLIKREGVRRASTLIQPRSFVSSRYKISSERPNVHLALMKWISRIRK